MALSKPKIKLDTTKIVKFLVEHGEKLVLGLFGFIALFLLYGVLGLPRLQETPEQLKQEADRALAYVNGTKPFDPKDHNIVVKDFSDKAKEVTQQIALTGFEWQPVRPPVWPPGNKRGEPQYLTIEDIQVHAGRGTFEVEPAEVALAPRAAAPAAPPPPEAKDKDKEKKAPAARRREAPKDPLAPPKAEPAHPANTQGMHYAVILGLVPVERQTQAFLQKFEGVAKPLETDKQPSYYPLNKNVAAWVERAEVIPGVPDDKLAWDMKWQRDNAKLKTRFKANREELAATNVISNDVTEGLPPLIEGWKPEDVVHEKLPLAKGKADAAAEVPKADVPVAEPENADLPDGMVEAAPAPVAAAGVAPDKNHVPYLLFRFFDFTAQEGRSYKYRVRLALHNPNHGVDAQYLERPDINKKAYVFTGPSEPSNIAEIPLAGELFAGELIPSTADREIGVSVALLMWLGTGERAESIRKDPTFRGQLANFRIEKPVLRDSHGTEAKLSDREVDVRTETAVLDFASEGEGPRSPADVLILDPSGRLTVRKATSFHARYKEVEDEAKKLDMEAKRQIREKKDAEKERGRGEKKKPAEGRQKTNDDGLGATN